MTESSLKITFSLAGLADLSKGINKAIFPLLNQAVQAVAQQTSIEWMGAVNNAKLSQYEKDEYVKSITWEMTGDFTATVRSNYKYDQEIENGRPQRDLKKMLNTSLKVRVSKTGNRYLYIPFRHNTPGSGATAAPMPTAIYKQAKMLSPSRVVGQGTRESGTGAYSLSTKKRLTVPQSKYSWGDSLPAGLAPKMKPHHKTDIYAGMKRFDTSTPGGAKSSQFLTFRTLSDKSKGWIIPSQPGQNIVKSVVDKIKPKAESAFSEAIKRSTQNV